MKNFEESLIQTNFNISKEKLKENFLEFLKLLANNKAVEADILLNKLISDR